MRLIDADALIADLEYDVRLDQDSLDYEDLTDMNRTFIQFDKDCKQNAIDLLKREPIVERGKGKWVRLPGKSSFDYYCPCCGALCMDVINDKPMWNFCPVCGTEIEGMIEGIVHGDETV